ncbi:TetR/AcrR family transcriptional regulator [Trebonia kvetii]|uniref:TetR/AcrR family transcriptional regulator n=1 Tax=Trebonia kvetii TaxID=2480626 RepID=A0A6P2BW83_9ACTN|nr:TetR/AcrR family transcriptional regulator C-terminal domain-containing protein [Trebonia kvetii]TVZ03389.1 TetR/AcrR family transcriptional regulator [Trebonia kvetii]
MSGLPRGSLTRELLVRESLRLLDKDGVAGFSLPKLGRALGADPTAIYRHFASKDDLILAIADAMIEEGLSGIEPSECWIETLRDLARRARHTSLAHPAAASLTNYRTTQGPAEMRAVDIIIGALHQAGFTGKEAAVVYRAFGDFTLFWSGGEATFLALDEAAQRKDREAWTRAYLVADRTVYPDIWCVREELPVVKDDDIFETILSLVLGGIAARAPRPCACEAHARAPR